MKSIKNSFLLSHALLMALLTGCGIDNYEMPQLALRGKIVDAQTNESVQSGGINSGSVIKLYEGESAQPLNFSTFPDGSFVNTKIFSGSYTYLAEGPFTLQSANRINLDMRKNMEIEIKVTPNVRVKTTLVSSTENSAVVKLVYEKVNKTQPLSHLGITWSTSPNPNMLVFTGGKTILDNVTDLNLSDSGEKTFTLTNLKPKTTYYVRGASRTVNPGNYYNYSPTFEVKTN